jgi:hypothetical protein
VRANPEWLKTIPLEKALNLSVLIQHGDPILPTHNRHIQPFSDLATLFGGKCFGCTLLCLLLLRINRAWPLYRFARCCVCCFSELIESGPFIGPFI